MTIDAVSLATSHLFGDAIASQHRLRHDIFIKQQQWNVPSWHGFEFDQFDTPATTYFIWRDDSCMARGVARITPTVLPYMLETLWPDMVTEEPLPKDPAVWEGSRIGIDRSLHPRLRRRILGELFCAYLEFGLREEVERFLVLMPVAFLKRTVTNVGWEPAFVGPVRLIGKTEVVAASMNVSPEILETVRTNMGIEGRVVRTADDILQSRAA